MQVPQDWTYRFRGHETGGMMVRCSWFLDLYQRNYILSSKLALVHVRQTCITATLFLGGVSQRASAGAASLRGGCTMASGLTFGESWTWLWWLWHGCIGGRWGASVFFRLVRLQLRNWCLEYVDPVIDRDKRYICLCLQHTVWLCLTCCGNFRRTFFLFST